MKVLYARTARSLGAFARPLHRQQRVEGPEMENSTQKRKRRNRLSRQRCCSKRDEKDLDSESGSGGVEGGQDLYATDSKEYFQGMFTSAFKESDSERDMLTPTVKLIGQSSVVLAILFLAFMKSNALL